MLGSMLPVTDGPLRREFIASGREGSDNFGSRLNLPPAPFRFPPLMLTAAGSEFEPAPLALLPPAETEAPFEPAPAPPGRSAPLGVPGFAPSGEMEMRAARFPCGRVATGAGGAGAVESAIT